MRDRRALILQIIVTLAKTGTLLLLFQRQQVLLKILHIKLVESIFYGSSLAVLLILVDLMISTAKIMSSRVIHYLGLVILQFVEISCAATVHGSWVSQPTWLAEMRHLGRACFSFGLPNPGRILRAKVSWRTLRDSLKASRS